MKKHASSYVNLISCNIILSEFSCRYFIQAEDELDCNWLFMRGQEDDDASWFKWLKDELYVIMVMFILKLPMIFAHSYRTVGSRIGADPSLTGALTWLEWQEYFQKQNMTLVTLIKNPIDEIWMNQPERSKDPLIVHEVKFAGKILAYCSLRRNTYSSQIMFIYRQKLGRKVV